MRSLRAALSARLLRYGTTVASDRELMWRTARRASQSLTQADYHLLGALDVASTVALRLGLLVMPAQPPELADAPR
jgi:hypothetical protein